MMGNSRRGAMGRDRSSSVPIETSVARTRCPSMISAFLVLRILGWRDWLTRRISRNSCMLSRLPLTPTRGIFKATSMLSTESRAFHTSQLPPVPRSLMSWYLPSRWPDLSPRWGDSARVFFGLIYAFLTVRYCGFRDSTESTQCLTLYLESQPKEHLISCDF